MAEKILVVHEQPQILDMWSLYLHHHDYTYHAEQQITDALSYLQECYAAVFLLDIGILEKYGWVICRELKQTLDITVIVMTECDEINSIMKSLHSGADDFVIILINDSDLSMTIYVWIDCSN